MTGPVGQKLLQDAIAKALSRAVDAATGYGSPFADGLTGLLKDAFRIPPEFNLTAYNDYVVKTVVAVVQQRLTAAVAAQVEARVEKLLPTLPGATTLAEVAEKFVADCRDRRRDGETFDEDDVTVLLDRDGAFTYLYLDRGVKTLDEKGRCDVCVGVHRDRVFSLRVRGVTTEAQLYVDTYRGFERYLFHLRASATPVTVDPAAVEDVNRHIGSCD